MKFINSLIILSIATFALPLSSLVAVAHEGHHSAEPPTKPILDESIFNLTSKWTSQEGKTISLNDLHGHAAVVAMVYTSCEKACPLIVEDLKKIEKQLLEKKITPVSILLFSFDTKRDTPEHLKAFADIRKLDLKRWTLFHGNEQAVRELAAVLGINYKRDSKGDFDHANVITLIDSEGLVRQQQVGLGQDPKQMIAKATELISNYPK